MMSIEKIENFQNDQSLGKYAFFWIFMEFIPFVVVPNAYNY